MKKQMGFEQEGLVLGGCPFQFTVCCTDEHIKLGKGLPPGTSPSSLNPYFILCRDFTIIFSIR